MNKISKALVMTGMALVAGAMMGAGPASAAMASPAAPQTATVQAPHAKVVGYYRSVLACHAAGKLGERRDRWDDHSCVRVSTGFRRGWFALAVRQDNHGHFPGHSVPGHNMPGHNMPGHSMPGHPMPGHHH